MSDYAGKTARLKGAWRAAGPLRLEKSTVSNLFRYGGRRRDGKGGLALGEFNEVIALDAAHRTLEVEGLATFETIVNHTLREGFLPLVAPELKHITIGGATVGIGIESTCFEHGFVHDSLIEADVLLPDGRIVTCTADNAYADLFAGLPNSYGTLGYILRAKIALRPADPHVHLRVRRFDDAGSYLDAMRREVEAGEAAFIEGLFFEDRRFLLMIGRFAPHVPQVDDILREHVFYKLVQQRSDVYLKTADYIFRYDPEWFWNIPESWFHTLFRRYAPRSCRNSAFYTKYAALTDRLRRAAGLGPPDVEPLIQDWEVPWENALELIEFCLQAVRLDGRPWAAVPIRTPRRPTLYPIEPGKLYFNLGCYCQVRKPSGSESYHYTRIMDRKCFELGGIKMLYSSSFLDQDEFDRRYNGAAYRALKAKYDRDGRARTLYAKVAFAPS